MPAEDQVSDYHTFDADAGRAVAASARRSIHVISLPMILNCTRPQADQLLAEKLLVPLGGGPSDARGRTQKAVDADDIAVFLAALEANARIVDAAPSGMVPISKVAEKAKMPSIAIVHLILGGSLETVFQLTHVSGLAGIILMSFYLVVGMFLEPIGGMLITLPIVLPIMEGAGYDLLWFGILLAKVLEIGLITPPIGLNVFVIKGVVGDRISLGTIFRGTTWFIAADCVTIGLAIAFPGLITYLPSLM